MQTKEPINSQLTCQLNFVQSESIYVSGDFFCIIGCNAEEKTNAQKIIYAINCKGQFFEPSENLAQEFKRFFHNFLPEIRANLLEYFAYSCAKKLFEKFSSIEEIEIELKKPQAIPGADYASVKLTTKRGAQK